MMKLFLVLFLLLGAPLHAEELETILKLYEAENCESLLNTIDNPKEAKDSYVRGFLYLNGYCYKKDYNEAIISFEYAYQNFDWRFTMPSLELANYMVLALLMCSF